MRLRLFAIVAAVGALIVSSVSASATSEKFNPPKQYYLALGDSLAFGFEQAKFVNELEHGTYNPASFDTGYVGDFAAMLQTVDPGITPVNYGCPGETTASFISGPCAYQALGDPTLGIPPLPLHSGYPGSQQAAALAFLHAHPGQVSPITLDDGANDITPCIGMPASCFAAALQQIGTNLDGSLGALRAAAPDSEIIVMEYYNPFYVVDPTSDSQTAALNDVIATVAAKHGARLANAFPAINHNPNFATEFLSVCGLTGMCFPAPGGDVHANDFGYSAIAATFWAASGYGRLGD
jgi:lysophospholipase L1-like esterase